LLANKSSRDEVLYHAKIHPEQYSNTLSDAQIKELHSSIHYVCSTAVDLLGDSRQFPTDWLFNHRWSKGKKNQPQKLANGDKIVFLTVGGRTSAIVPSVQRKTGPVAKDVAKEDLEDVEDDPEAEKKPPTKSQAKTERNVMNKDANSNRAKGIKVSSRKTNPKRRSVKEEKTETNLTMPSLDSRKRKVAQETVNGGAKEGVPGAKKMKHVASTPKETQTPLRRGRSAASK
jgi:formamidopyrimidine-DNA glycosylase